MTAIVDLMPERHWECRISGCLVTFIGPPRPYSRWRDDPDNPRGRPLEDRGEWTPVYQVILANNLIDETDDQKKRRALSGISYHQMNREGYPGVIFFCQDLQIHNTVKAWPWTDKECALDEWLWKHVD